MNYHFTPSGVCSRSIDFSVENGKIIDISIAGGCSGNLSGISSLVKGMEVDEVIEWYLSAHIDSNGNHPPFLESTFSDIEDSEHKYYIQCANSMHIVYGRGDGIFDPDAPITREEAAAMLLRVYFCYGGGVKLGPKSEGVDAFYDVAEISSWADSAVRYMYQWDVMKGVSDTHYAPKSYYTKEQCYATFLRLDDVYSYR